MQTKLSVTGYSFNFDRYDAQALPHLKSVYAIFKVNKETKMRKIMAKDSTDSIVNKTDPKRIERDNFKVFIVALWEFQVAKQVEHHWRREAFLAQMRLKLPRTSDELPAFIEFKHFEPEMQEHINTLSEYLSKKMEKLTALLSETVIVLKEQVNERFKDNPTQKAVATAMVENTFSPKKLIPEILSGLDDLKEFKNTLEELKRYRKSTKQTSSNQETEATSNFHNTLLHGSHNSLFDAIMHRIAETRRATTAQMMIEAAVGLTLTQRAARTLQSQSEQHQLSTEDTDELANFHRDTMSHEENNVARHIAQNFQHELLSDAEFEQEYRLSSTDDSALEQAQDNKTREMAEQSARLEAVPDNKTLEMAQENAQQEQTPDNKTLEAMSDNKTQETTPDNKTSYENAKTAAPTPQPTPSKDENEAAELETFLTDCAEHTAVIKPDAVMDNKEAYLLEQKKAAEGKGPAKATGVPEASETSEAPEPSSSTPGLN